MNTGNLYFIKDEFYERFKDYNLLGNKPAVESQEHNRPCCYLFATTLSDSEKIYWMIPLSSKVEKYENQYKQSMKKYNMCDNISFGYVLGEKRAFLPQNLFPVTEEYIQNIYIDKNTGEPISIPKDLQSELNKKARKKLRYNQKGKSFGLTESLEIYNLLISNNETK